MYKIHKRFISHLLCIAILLPALLVPSHAINSNDIYSIPTTFDHSSTVVMPDTTSTINYESPLTEDFLEILEYAPPGSAVRVDSEGNVSLVDKSNQVYSNIPDQTTDFGSMSSTNSTNNDAPVTLDATPDTRTRVRNVNDYPNCAVVEIVSTFPDGGVLRGSGAFIGPKGILTAGHVLYQKEHGIASSVTIYPGGGLSNFSPIALNEQIQKINKGPLKSGRMWDEESPQGHKRGKPHGKYDSRKSGNRQVLFSARLSKAADLGAAATAGGHGHWTGNEGKSEQDHRLCRTEPMLPDHLWTFPVRRQVG